MPKAQFTNSSGKSLTIPGQSLVPGDLLKRHLAGTLPPLDHSQRYEYHYNEDGEQIAEPLPLEYHEMHALAIAIRKREFEEATRKRAANAKKLQERIINEFKNSDEYKSRQASAAPEGKAAQSDPPSGA